MQVFVAQNGKTSGPYTQRQIRRRYDQGKLRPDDHIWYEGAADWMPAAWIENWADFRKASHRQRDAVAFLGGASPPGILTLEAEELIATLARESGREDELQRWYVRYDKFAELAEWWANRPGDIGVPGGHGVLQVALQEVHDTNPELFQRITPMDVLARVDHFRVGGWRNEPATERQIAYLESIGENLWPGITKGEAHDLIDRASDAQLRRLDFYGIRPSGLLTKQRASEMINGYIAKHPESEEQYQRWKAENGIR